MSLIFDVETIGLPKCPGYGRYYPYTDNSKYDSSRIVQLSFMLCNENFETIEIKDYIIRVDFQIGNSDFHGITNEISTTHGVLFSQAIDEFYRMLQTVSHVIAHNLDFDFNIILNELYRIDCFQVINELLTKQKFCTMKRTKEIVGAMNRYGLKDPNLGELYKFALGRSMENAHNSKYDIINTHQALKTLINTGRIRLSENFTYRPNNIEETEEEEVEDGDEEVEEEKKEELEYDSSESHQTEETITDDRKANFAKFTVPQLRQNCKNANITGYSILNKNELIDKLCSTT